MPIYNLKINGQARKVDAPADTPLLWILRDNLELVGTKYGCGAGLCGACTVHLNGIPNKSCQTPVSTVVGLDIRTIEGLSPDGGHPLQKSWIAHDVPQCGYCQSGQIMTAAALLARNANPSDTDIDDALAGNLCRCGTYLRIRAAVKDAAAMMRGEKVAFAPVIQPSSSPECCGATCACQAAGKEAMLS
jgi:isoquinoline 1-oxidoreductase alpha subunit